MRRLARSILALPLGILAILWAGYTVAFLKFNDRTLGKFISGKINAVDRGQFLLESAHYPYWGGLGSILFNTPAHVVGEDFTLVDPDGDTIIRVPRVETGAHLRELIASLAKTAAFGGRRFFLTLHFSHAQLPLGWGVVGPTRSTWGHEKAETNIIAAFGSRKLVPPSLGATIIQVDDLEIGDAAFFMGFAALDGKPSWWTKVKHLHGKVALTYNSSHALQTPDGPYFFFRVLDAGAPTAELHLGDLSGYQFPLENLKVSEFGVHGDVRQRLHFAATATTIQAGVRATGELVDAYSEHPGVDLTLEFDHGRGPMALLEAPLSTWLGGDPHGTIRIAGPFSHPVIDGDVHEFEANLEGILFDHGSARLHFDQGLLTLRPVTGKIAHGDTSADVDVQLHGRWSALVTLRGVDPALLPHLPKSVASELAGRLDARVKLSGSLVRQPGHIALTRLAAELVRARAGGKLPRKLTISGAGEYSPTAITLTGMSAAGDGVTVGATGTIEPRSGRVNANLRVDAGAGAPWWQRLGAPAALRIEALHANGHISGALVRPTLTLHAAATGVAYARRTLDHLEADLSLRGGTLVVSNLRGDGLGATVSGDAELDLFDGDLEHPRAEPTLKAQLRARGLSVAVLSGLPLLQGAADVDINVSGALAHPHGRASITLPKLAIGGDSYSGGRLQLAFTDEGARVEQLSLQRVRGGSISGSGTVGWNGDLALQLQPRDLPLTAIPWLSAVPVPIAGALSGDLALGGTIDRLTPSGLLQLIGFKVRDVLLGKGSLKLEPGSDAIHIAGDFFGNVHVDGYITLVPKVSVVATISFKNLALERFYPEITKLAEISGLATGEAAISIDSESGFTFAKLTLTQLTLTLTSTDENGRPTRLIVKNPPEMPVQLTTDGRSLEIQRAVLQSVIGEFMMKGTIGKRNDVYMRGRIGLELLEYFFRGLFEHTHGPANVELSITGDLQRPQVKGYVEIGGGKGAAELVPRGLEGKLTLRVPSGRIEISPQSIRLSNVTVATDKDKLAHASGEVALVDWVPGAIRGEISGDLSPRLFQWPLNNYIADAAGRLHLDVAVRGVWSHPEWHGTASVHDVTFRVRRIERELRIDKGTIVFDNFDVAIGCPRNGARPTGCTSLTGMIDEESKIDAVDGRVSIGDEWSLKRVDVWADGREIRYAQPGWALSVSPRVELVGDGNQLTLRGAVDLVEGRYSQNFDLLGMVFHPRVVEQSEPFWQGNPLFETTRLALRAQSTGPLLVKNNLAELTIGATLDISGTLSEPHLAGSINIDEAGRLSPPGFRYAFETDRGTVRFDEDKKIPDQTPTIDLYATTPYIDRYEQQHTLWMRLSGTALSLRLDLGSLDGWDKATVLVIIFGGQSPDDIRRAAQGSVATVAPSSGARGSATDNVAKTLSGATVGQFISDPLKRVTGFDTVNVEFGGSSFDLKLCKRFGRYFKTCGQGELGFAGSSRFGGTIELKLSDRPLEWSGVGRVEYLTRGVETLQDSLTSGRGELKLRLPLGF